jgi:hypothetical protein
MQILQLRKGDDTMMLKRDVDRAEQLIKELTQLLYSFSIEDFMDFDEDLDKLIETIHFQRQVAE